MLRWRLMTYETHAGNNPTLDWYNAQGPEIQAEFDTRMRELAVTSDWFTARLAKSLTGPHSGLHEILIENRSYVLVAGKRKLRKIECRPGSVLYRHIHGQMGN